MEDSSLNYFCTSTKRLVKQIFISSFQNMFTNRCNCYENFLVTNITSQITLSILIVKNLKSITIKFFYWKATCFNPLNANHTQWSNTLKQFVCRLLTSCLSVLGRFLELELKGLKFTYFPSKNDREFDYFMIDRKISKWNFFAVFFKRQRKITPWSHNRTYRITSHWDIICLRGKLRIFSWQQYFPSLFVNYPLVSCSWHLDWGRTVLQTT